jgi:hypothetical protein
MNIAQAQTIWSYVRRFNKEGSQSSRNYDYAGKFRTMQIMCSRKGKARIYQRVAMMMNQRPKENVV